jgi:cyclophilin family peptidyl-prolyl cis-trans isomerase
VRKLVLLVLGVSLAACSDGPPPSGKAETSAPLEATNVVDKSDPNWKTSLDAPPTMMSFDASKNYFWTLSTNKGSMRFRLFPDVARMHVNSTIYLTEQGFYDDVIFHRVIPGFMAQGGDPTGTGQGGPGYRYDGEFSETVVHDRPGLLSMANAGPGTDGSQFFITFAATPWLNGKHTIFGELVEGEEVLKTFEEAGSRSGAVSEELKIIKATIDVQ